jgi:hypothetical protein
LGRRSCGGDVHGSRGGTSPTLNLLRLLTAGFSTKQKSESIHLVSPFGVEADIQPIHCDVH